MEKRGNKLLIGNVAIFEIILLVSFSFAIAFILQENLVSSYGTTPPALGEGVGELLETNVPAQSSGGWLSEIFTETTPTKANLGIIEAPMPSFFTAHLLEGVVWGGIVALGIKFLGPMVGLSEEQSNAAAIAE